MEIIFHDKQAKTIIVEFEYTGYEVEVTLPFGTTHPIVGDTVWVLYDIMKDELLYCEDTTGMVASPITYRAVVKGKPSPRGLIGNFL